MTEAGCLTKPEGVKWTGVVLGVAGTQALHAQQEMQRTELQRFDLTGVNGTEVVMGVLEIAPGTTVPRHIHYGDEFAYVLQGGMIEAPGQAPSELKPGTPLHVAREVPHGGGKNVGTTPVKILTVHIVDKGKPLSELVK
jgi:quercetin dioxygenase-like cupin family protein